MVLIDNKRLRSVSEMKAKVMNVSLVSLLCLYRQSQKRATSVEIHSTIRKDLNN